MHGVNFQNWFWILKSLRTSRISQNEWESRKNLVQRCKATQWMLMTTKLNWLINIDIDKLYKSNFSATTCKYLQVLVIGGWTHGWLVVVSYPWEYTHTSVSTGFEIKKLVSASASRFVSALVNSPNWGLQPLSSTNHAVASKCRPLLENCSGQFLSSMQPVCEPFKVECNSG